MAKANEKLAPLFTLPPVSKAELSAEQAAAVRAREARLAAAEREAADRAAERAGMLTWHKKQAELAAELEISFTDWQRIVALLKDHPPVHIGDRLVSCSVLIGKALVVRAAVRDAFTEPVRESVRNAAKRAAE